MKTSIWLLVGVVGAGAWSAIGCGDSDDPKPAPRAGTSGGGTDAGGEGGETASGGTNPGGHSGAADDAGEGGKSGEAGKGGGGSGGTLSPGQGGAGETSASGAGSGPGPAQCESLDCDDHNRCTVDTCMEGEGCSHDGTGVTDECDDGDACTADDVCQGDRAGTCAGVVMSTMCDDSEPCTVDRCNTEGGCDHDVVVSNECRPSITITYPPRGATIQGTADDRTVAVQGRVNSEKPLDSLTINGEPVAVASDGAFVYSAPVGVGANTLVFEAENALGGTRTRVQTFLWSTGYLRPDRPKNGIAADAVWAWFAKTVVDDGDHTLPADDIATLVESGVEREYGLDHRLIGNFDPLIVHAESVRISDADVTLDVLDGGVRAHALLSNIVAALAIEAQTPSEAGPIWTDLGPAALTYDTGAADVTFAASVDQEHLVALTATDIDVTLGTPTFHADDPELDALGADLLAVLGPSLESQVIGEFQQIVSTELARQLSDSLNHYVGNVRRELDRPDASGAKVRFDVVSDYASALFEDDEGVTLALRSGAYGTTPLPTANLGLPLRAACLGPQSPPVFPREQEVEFLVADDTVNQHLFGAWREGYWSFVVPPSDLDIGTKPIQHASLALNGLLALTATDCYDDGAWRGTLGDVRLTFACEYDGMELTGEGYATLVLKLEPNVGGDRLSVRAVALESLRTDFAVNEEAGVRYEEELHGMLETYLRYTLFPRLAAQQLAFIGLPNVSGIEFVSAEVERVPGYILASGEPGEAR